MAAAACHDEPPDDGRRDAEIEVGKDAGRPDARSDGGRPRPDAGDAGRKDSGPTDGYLPDADSGQTFDASDAGDAEVDAGPDSGPDTGPDSGPDASDADPDASDATSDAGDHGLIGDDETAVDAGDDGGGAVANTPPRFDTTPLTTALEESSYTYAAHATDPDPGDAVTYSITGPSGMTIDASGVVSWTPPSGAAGEHAIELVATDSHGATDTQRFTLVVFRQNHPPSIVSAPPPTATEHATWSYAPLVLDPDLGDAVVFSLDVAPPGMAETAPGVFTWTPSEADVGTAEVVLRATDLAGAFDLQSFTLAVIGVNDPPYFSSTPPTTGIRNQPWLYVAQIADPDRGDQVVLSVREGPLGMWVEPTSNLVSWVPSRAGTEHVVLRVTDLAGAWSEQSFDVVVAADGGPCLPGSNEARCSAFAWTHVFGADGVPIANDPVTVTELGPGGERHPNIDPVTGEVVLGGAAGAYTWIFSAPNRAPVWRSAALSEGTPTLVPTPRLARIDDLRGALDSNALHLADVDGRVELDFAPNSASSPVTIRAAVLDGQTLPGLLPRGYSPAAALWYDASGPLAAPPAARFRLPAALPDSATLVFAWWDETSAEWVASSLVTPTGDVAHPEVDVVLDGPGGYAILLADSGVGAPNVVPGWTLPEGTLSWPALSALAATSEVEPAYQAASLDPRDVTGRGHLWVTGGTDVLASGLVLPARFVERYTFTSGVRAELPAADLTVALHRYPPAGRAPTNALSAALSLRPTTLFGARDLSEALQRLELHTSIADGGVAVGASGGLVAADGLVLSIPGGALAGTARVTLDALPFDALADLGESGLVAEAAFTLTWSGAPPGFGRVAFDAPGLLPNHPYVLARRELSDAGVGWSPVERYATDANARLQTREPVAGPALPGLRRSGTYALFRRDVAEGLVRGTVSSPTGEVVSRAVVTVAGAPWLVATDTAGDYATLATPGQVNARAELPSTGDDGDATGALADAASTLELAITLGPRAPRIARTDPAAGATSARVITAIEVFFTEAVLPVTVPATNAITLSDGTGQAIAGTQSLRPDGRSLAFFPTSPLAYATQYSVEVSGAITDVTGLALEGDRTFSFTTELAPARATGGLRLVSYAPGSLASPCSAYDARIPRASGWDPTGIAIGVPGFDPREAVTCVVGGPGLADPNSAVILVNESTGQTVTVTSVANGSFKSFIRASTEDLLSAVVVNANGTSVAVPLEQQRFDDGRVALYRGGGTIDALNPFGGAPIQLVIEPGAIARRAVFGFSGQTVEDVEVAAGGTRPVEGQLISGLHATYEGEPMGQSADVRIPMPESALQLPFGASPTDVGFVLARVRHVEVEGQDTLVYQVIDRMRYEDGVLATHSYPMDGLALTAGVAWDLGIIQLPIAPVAVSGYVVVCPPGASSCEALLSARTLDTGTLDPNVVPAEGTRLPGAVVIATQRSRRAIARVR